MEKCQDALEVTSPAVAAAAAASGSDTGVFASQCTRHCFLLGEGRNDGESQSQKVLLHFLVCGS